MDRKYNIRCKLCGDILSEKIPVKKLIKCSCGNIGLYSDYIAYNYNNKLSREDCYEDLDKEKLDLSEVEKYLEYQEKINHIN